MSTSLPSPAEETFNPYAAPKAEIGSDIVPEMQADDELGGVVWGVVCFFLAGRTFWRMSSGLPRGAGSGEDWISGGLGIGLLALGVLVFFLGTGLRRFRPWARWTEVALATTGALANVAWVNVIGLLFRVYFLYLMLSQKGTMVFSPEYQAVIARTPHIKYKTSIIVKVAVAILLIVFGLAVIGGITAAVLSE